MKNFNLCVSGYKGFQTLQLCIFKKLDINCVYTYQNKININFSKKIIDICKKYKIKYSIVNSKDMKTSFITDKLISFFIGWQYLSIQSKYIYVFHDSLLPSYSGFSPTVSALIQGDKKIGISLFIPNNNMDSGKIIFQKKINLNYPIKINEVYNLIVIEIFNTIKNVVSNKKIIFKKNSLKRTYSIWRDQNDYFIDWNKSSKYIKRFIDSLGYPYDCAKAKYNGKIINIIDSHVVNKFKFVEYHPGKICFIEDSNPLVMTKNSLLKITSATDRFGKKISFKSIRKRFA